ncbi:class I SAM-dependent methyltransferase [Fundidesulfovibrio butyratiphilus]
MGTQWLGLRYPDIYVTRFFFKNQLDATPSKVIELGCGTGNNLRLFAEFGHDVSGIDIDADSIDMCRNNIGTITKNGDFFHHDLEQGLPASVRDKRYDVLLLPNILYYLKRGTVHSLLAEIRRIATPGGLYCAIVRLLDDYRYARGSRVGVNEYLVTMDETGERGARQLFFGEHEFVSLISDSFGVSSAGMTILRTRYENIQNDHLISNSDLVVWGRFSA